MDGRIMLRQYQQDNASGVGGEMKTLTPDQAKWLFEKLAREGECWHEFEFELDGKYCMKCGKPAIGCRNPNLTSPGWPEFGWCKDRLVEKGSFVNFCNYCWRKLYKVIPTAIWGGSLPQEYIYPPRFISTLHEFLKERE
ncbi:MAG: hypothetical protein ACE14T_11185 [Syntrophales bacterium]